jgi:hypothetical protein
MLSFYWDAFDIERMVWEKTVSANFSGAWWGASVTVYLDIKHYD